MPVKNTTIVFGCMLLVGIASPAFASDYSGAMATLFGVPLMGVAAVVYGVLALFPRLHPTGYVVAAIAFALLAACGLWMTDDAVAALRRYPGLASLFFALFGLTVVCFAVLTWRHRSHRANLRAQEGLGQR
jgi:hypothetical protein